MYFLIAVNLVINLLIYTGIMEGDNLIVVK